MKYKNLILFGTISFSVSFLFGIWFLKTLKAPKEFNQEIILTLNKNRSFKSLVKELEEKTIIQNSWTSWIYARIFNHFQLVSAGTYKLKPQSSVQDIVHQFMHPPHNWVRIPEGFWIKRTAQLLEKKNVCKAQKYIELCHQPHLFQNKVSFQLPKKSLEGYLYPDTYDFKQNTDPSHIIIEQLKEFEKQVIKPLKKSSEISPEDLIIASILQLEASDLKERRMISGIINARLKKNMSLQLCSTVLYALQTWRPLNIGEAQQVRSSYNTYRNKGLPPGPICSPSKECIQAALNPIVTPYLFFVSAPNDRHFFSTTFDEHVRNIQRSRSLLKN